MRPSRLDGDRKMRRVAAGIMVLAVSLLATVLVIDSPDGTLLEMTRASDGVPGRDLSEDVAIDSLPVVTTEPIPLPVTPPAVQAQILMFRCPVLSCPRLLPLTSRRFESVGTQA